MMYRSICALQLSIIASLCGATCEATAAQPSPTTYTITDFSKEADRKGWEIEDDGVMGGVSRGRFTIDERGHAVFTGQVSLENDGGFSSLQYYFDPIDVSAFHTACIHLKGDGKDYQFLVESNRADKHYYALPFSTSGEWEVVKIPFSEMIPFFRGDRLDIPNYPGEQLAMVRLMIANKKEESFRLEIERIWLE